MKTKKFNRKLSFIKSTIADLNPLQSAQIKGGVETDGCIIEEPSEVCVTVRFTNCNCTFPHICFDHGHNEPIPTDTCTSCPIPC